MVKDSPLFEYAKSQVYTDPEFIYFDEECKKDEKADSVLGARLIITMLIEASEGNMIKLQALMCVFAGMSLREAAEQCGKSHEYVRLKIESIKQEYPELYLVLTDRDRFKVTSLIPIGKTKKWTITNLKTNKTVYISNLHEWCKERNIAYHCVIHSLRKLDGKYGEYQYIRNY